ncbi:hypothetical protein RI129_008486 [Pyrocoelia pectoralis]|uniref:Uncharacterized protein n=1 Tax=Pyrocoelia pectoralis TaxID=417401 RepID=A0AAN7VFC5_9COLE
MSPTTVAVLLLFSINNIVYSAAKFVPESITSCEEGEQYVNMNSKPVGEDREWTGDATIPFEIDQTTEFAMDFYWWKNDKWEQNGKTTKGKVCFYFERFAGHLWSQIKQAAQPKLLEDCHVPSGKYEFDKFVPDLSDLIIPVGGKGRASATFTMKKGEKTLCVIITGDFE